MAAELIDSAARHLLGSGEYGPASTGVVDGVQLGQRSEGVFCVNTYTYRGDKYEKEGAAVMLWMCFVVTILVLVFYAYHWWKASTGWEEVYVAVVELCCYAVEIYHHFDSPVTLFLADGTQVPWLRYLEWLMTCPVILIHTSNLTGLQDDYSKRTMNVLVGVIGVIVLGAVSAMAKGPVKVLFYIASCVYAVYTYYYIVKVYLEAYRIVPRGICKILVKIMAIIFFSSWNIYPILFLLGPEGFNHLSIYGSVIAHTVGDLLAKNLWGLCGHMLRFKIHEHILIHGDIRHKTKLKFGGEEVEVEEFLEAEEAKELPEDEIVKNDTAKLYSKRASFHVMAENLKRQGVEVKANLDGQMSDGPTCRLDPGRVVVGLPDMAMLEYLREQFFAYANAIEMVPAIGADNTLALANQAAMSGGCDCVLLSPELVRDKGANSLVNKLKASGHRVVAFGWLAGGPVREIIETANLDGWIEGPGIGVLMNSSQFAQVLAAMQQQRKMAGSFGGMMGGMAGMGGMGQMAAAPQAAANPMAAAGMNPMMMAMFQQMMGAAAAAPAAAPAMPAAATTNPLFAGAVNPMAAMMAANPMMGAMAAAARPASAAASQPGTPRDGGMMSEKEMLSHLMEEITKLKTELGPDGM